MPIIAYTPETYVVNYIGGTCLCAAVMSVQVESGIDFESENLMFAVDLTGLVDSATYSYQVTSDNTEGSTISAPQTLVISELGTLYSTSGGYMLHKI